MIAIIVRSQTSTRPAILFPEALGQNTSAVSRSVEGTEVVKGCTLLRPTGEAIAAQCKHTTCPAREGKGE